MSSFLRHFTDFDPRVVVMVQEGRLVLRRKKKINMAAWKAHKSRAYNKLLRLGAARDDETAVNGLLDCMQAEKLEVEAASIKILREMLVTRVFGQPREEMGR